MPIQTDLTIPLSALTFLEDGVATVIPESWNTTQIGVLLQTVIEQHADAQLKNQTLHFVSVTYDVSAEVESGTDVRFESRIDRRTRTLIFASGLARQGDRNLLKATVVFRLT
ncbi:MAG: hypothetical protein AAF437_05980 [Pseudomonadota bacterium]